MGTDPQVVGHGMDLPFRWTNIAGNEEAQDQGLWLYSLSRIVFVQLGTIFQVKS